MEFDQEVKEDMARDDIEAATEAAHCALVNFDNVAKMAPVLGRHPIFMMARAQLAEAVKLLGRDPDTLEV